MDGGTPGTTNGDNGSSPPPSPAVIPPSSNFATSPAPASAFVAAAELSNSFAMAPSAPATAPGLTSTGKTFPGAAEYLFPAFLSFTRCFLRCRVANERGRAKSQTMFKGGFEIARGFSGAGWVRNASSFSIVTLLQELHHRWVDLSLHHRWRWSLQRALSNI